MVKQLVATGQASLLFMSRDLVGWISMPLRGTRAPPTRRARAHGFVIIFRGTLLTFKDEASHGSRRMKTRGRPENATQGEFRFDVASTLYTPGHDLALSPQLSELSQRPYNTPTRPRTIAGRFVGRKYAAYHDP